MRKIPQTKPELYIVVEGYTDSETLKWITDSLEKYYKLNIQCANSGDRILDKYHKLKKQNSEREVVVLYDLDNKKTIKDIAKLYKDKEIEISLEYIYFINPLIELLWYLSKNAKAVKYTKKEQFKSFIKKEFDVDDYVSSQKQVDKIIKKLTKEDAEKLFKNVKKYISDDDSILPSTNILKLKDKIEGKIL